MSRPRLMRHVSATPWQLGSKSEQTYSAVNVGTVRRRTHRTTAPAHPELPSLCDGHQLRSPATSGHLRKN